MGFLVKILILAGIGNIGKSLPQLAGFRQVIFWVKWAPDLQREREVWLVGMGAWLQARANDWSVHKMDFFLVSANK